MAYFDVSDMALAYAKRRFGNHIKASDVLDDPSHPKIIKMIVASDPKAFTN